MGDPPGALRRSTLDGRESGSRGEDALIAERLEMTEGAVGKAAHDLRQQFAQRIRQEVRDTVARDEDVEGELRYLVRLMQD